MQSRRYVEQHMCAAEAAAFDHACSSQCKGIKVHSIVLCGQPQHVRHIAYELGLQVQRSELRLELCLPGILGW